MRFQNGFIKYMSHAKVIEPPELVEKLKRKLRKCERSMFNSPKLSKIQKYSNILRQILFSLKTKGAKKNEQRYASK
jgi:hypothetical protein